MTLEQDRLHQRLGGAQASVVRPLVTLLALSLDYNSDLAELVAAAEAVVRTAGDIRDVAAQLLATRVRLAAEGGRP